MSEHFNEYNHRYGYENRDCDGRIQQVDHRNFFQVVFHIDFSLSDREWKNGGPVQTIFEINRIGPGSLYTPGALPGDVLYKIQ
jgi:hypothetical protein